MLAQFPALPFISSMVLSKLCAVLKHHFFFCKIRINIILLYSVFMRII